MGKHKYWEVFCDTCSSAIGHYSNAGMIYRQVKANGGFTRGTKHYCSLECLPKKTGSTKPSTNSKPPKKRGVK